MSISSTFVSGLLDRDPPSSLSHPEAAELEAILDNALKIKTKSVEERGHQYFVDKPAGSLDAVPVVEYAVDTIDGGYVVLLDAATNAVMDVRTTTNPYVAKEITTNTAARDHYNTPGCGSGCATGYSCVNNNCVRLCTSDAQCQVAPFDADWICNAGTPFNAFCVEPYGGAVSDVILAYSTAGSWVDPGYQYFHLLYEPKTVLDALDAWMYEDLGICSWSNDCVDPKALRVRIMIDYDDLTSSSGSFNSSENYMNIYDASDTPLGSSDYRGWASRFQFYGHEFGHGIHLDPGNLFYPNECAMEIHAQIHGALFAADSFKQTWGTYNQSAYMDEVHGLTAGSGTLIYLPYAQRFVFDNGKCIDSMFDWTDFTGVTCAGAAQCGPWEYCQWNSALARYECNTRANYNNNRYIWTRFARIWAEGSATFSENELGESMGYTFSGAGLDNAAAIYSEVIQQGIMDTSTTLQDFAYELIANAGTYANATRYALGAIGMLTGEYSVTGSGSTDRPTAAVLYSDWTLSANDKNFYAWKENGTGTIKVRYHDGSAYQEVAWTTANAGTAPTMAVFNSRLHIFWADATDGTVKFRYFTPGGYVYGTYSLSGLGGGIAVDGDFEAVTFNGYLYLVYRKSGSSYLYVSRCREATYGCTGDSSDWEPFTGSYQKSLGIRGRPGVAATPGTGLHSLPAEESGVPYLYVVYAYADGTSPDYRRIKVSRMTTGDTIDGTVMIHASAPSSTTNTKIAASFRTSAYSSAGKYIYIAWKDYSGTSTAYFSVLQSWDGNDGKSDHSNYWFTRPHKLGIQTSQGLTFKKYSTNEPYSIVTEIMFVDGSTPRRASFFGRY